MDHQGIFSKYVRRHFSYLVDELSYVLVEDQYAKESSSCIVAFLNNWRHVRLIWGLKDTQLYFGIFRVMKDGKPARYADYSSDHFYIFSLALFFEPQLDIRDLTSMDYDPIDPRILEAKVKGNAELLYKHGKEILKGGAWFDWQKEELIMEPQGF